MLDLRLPSLFSSTVIMDRRCGPIYKNFFRISTVRRHFLKLS